MSDPMFKIPEIPGEPSGQTVIVSAPTQPTSTITSSLSEQNTAHLFYSQHFLPAAYQSNHSTGFSSLPSEVESIPLPSIFGSSLKNGILGQNTLANLLPPGTTSQSVLHIPQNSLSLSQTLPTVSTSDILSQQATLSGDNSRAIISKINTLNLNEQLPCLQQISCPSRGVISAENIPKSVSLHDGSVKNDQASLIQMKENEDKQEKPPYSYVALISMAIKDAPQRMLPLSAIYDFISNNYPYYKRYEKGWQNSIRHNLSLNKFFLKIPREVTSSNERKGNNWTIDPAEMDNLFEDGNYKRRKKMKRKPTTPYNRVNPSFSNGHIDQSKDPHHVRNALQSQSMPSSTVSSSVSSLPPVGISGFHTERPQRPAAVLPYSDSRHYFSYQTSQACPALNDYSHWSNHLQYSTSGFSYANSYIPPTSLIPSTSAAIQSVSPSSALSYTVANNFEARRDSMSSQSATPTELFAHNLTPSLPSILVDNSSILHPQIRYPPSTSTY